MCQWFTKRSLFWDLNHRDSKWLFASQCFKSNQLIQTCREEDPPISDAIRTSSHLSLPSPHRQIITTAITWHPSRSCSPRQWSRRSRPPRGITRRPDGCHAMSQRLHAIITYSPTSPWQPWLNEAPPKETLKLGMCFYREFDVHDDRPLPFHQRCSFCHHFQIQAQNTPLLPASPPLLWHVGIFMFSCTFHV